MSKIKNVFRGKTIDGKIVISGKEIFKLIDTYGFPLDLIYEILNEKNIIFDFHEFIISAIDSGNFSIDKIRKTLSVLPYYCEEKFRSAISLIFKDNLKMGS